MAAPGGPRPRNAPPPNYNPNALADGMQNLQVNRPNQPPGAPRPNTPFGQQPPFAGGPPVSRPGPLPPGVFPRGPAPPGGPPHNGLPPSVAQSVPPFASRPPPPGVMPPSMGGVPPSPGSSPFGLGSRPGPPDSFSSSPLTTGPAVPPPSSISSSVSNGPPSGGPGMMQGGARIPPPSNAMRPPFGAPPPAMVSPGASSQPSRMRSPFGSSSCVSTTPVTAQPPPPFSGSFQNVPPPPGFSPFAAPSQAMPPPMGAPPMGTPHMGAPPIGAPYGTQSWWNTVVATATPSGDLFMPILLYLFCKGAPPSALPGSMQPPSMYGMAPPLSNQAVASITSSIGHSSPSKVDPNQIPRPIPNASVVLHETRQCNQANPPPIPRTVDLLTTSAMQLALLIQPLALPHPSEQPLQVVDFGENGPVRCSRCKGYINPFVKFIDQGRRFICNFCGDRECQLNKVTKQMSMISFLPDGPKYDCKDHDPDYFDEFVNSPRNPAKICFFDSTWQVTG
ncbi:putative 40S ribosomal protein S24-1-like [Capsicum annuum]|nr:putative 40S ribosomal protein S24-1-like [Capsicum annuum]